jgi:hypothetical protein
MLDVFASAHKLRTPPVDAPLGMEILAGRRCKSRRNFSWLHPFLLEKANDHSLLVTIEPFEMFKRKAFSVKKDMVLRHGA